MERYSENVIRKYGSQVIITGDDKTVETMGIIRPLYYRDRTRSVFSRLPAGLFDNRHYLIILKPDVKLKKKGGETLECNCNKYTVNSNGSYFVKKKLLYVWAVLTACTDPVEDDYDKDN